jgi:hypothetical protein
MSEAVESPKVSTLTVLTILVMLLVFVGLVWVVSLQKEAIPTATEQTRAERLKNLAQLNADNQKTLTTYHWVDKSKGIVGIPINRAMELVLKDLAANHPHAAGPVNLPAASPTPAASPAPAPAAANQKAIPAPSTSATPAPSPAASPSSSPEPSASPQSSASPEQSASPEPIASPNPSTSPTGH